MSNWLTSLLGLDAGNATIDAGNQNKTVVQQYGDTASNLIDTGATQAGGHLGDANNLAQLGLNAVGTDFKASPGYQFSLDQGLQALDRTAASRGLLGSGNTTADTLKYATGTADQEYNNWLTQLHSAVGTGIGTNDNLANLATGTATAKTGIAGDVAGGLTSSNNEVASGQEANAAGLASLGKTLFGAAGKIFGYGGF